MKQIEILPPPPPFPALEGERENLSSSAELELPEPPTIGQKSEYKEFKTNEAEDEIIKAVKKIKKKPSFWKRAFSSAPKMPKFKKLIEANGEIEIKPEIGIDSLNNLIKSARDALLDFNLDKARELYIEANKIYNSLSKEKQAKVYEDLKSLYEERKNAEALHLA